VANRASFMTAIYDVFCLSYTDAGIVTLDYSYIMGGYNTADSVARDRRSWSNNVLVGRTGGGASAALYACLTAVLGAFTGGRWKRQRSRCWRRNVEHLTEQRAGVCTDDTVSCRLQTLHPTVLYTTFTITLSQTYTCYMIC